MLELIQVLQISWQGASEVVKGVFGLSYGMVMYCMIWCTTYLVWGYRYTYTHMYTEPNFFGTWGTVISN